MFVYAIYNSSHKKTYVGQTSDLKERLKLHNEGTLGGYTSRFTGEWVLIYREEHQTRKQALIREKQLKSFRGREFIKRNIPQ